MKWKKPDAGVNSNKADFEKIGIHMMKLLNLFNLVYLFLFVFLVVIVFNAIIVNMIGR